MLLATMKTFTVIFFLQYVYNWIFSVKIGNPSMYNKKFLQYNLLEQIFVDDCQPFLKPRFKIKSCPHK